MRYTPLVLVLFLALVSCEKSKEKRKTLEFPSFTIKVPETWSQVKYDGIDSSIEQIITDGADSINIEFGQNSPPFDDVIKVYSFRDKVHFDSMGWPTEGKIFSKRA